MWSLNVLLILGVLGQCFSLSASPHGFLTQSLYSDRDCEEYGKPFAYTSTAYGECVKIFNGPEDPSTELTSFKLEVSASGSTQLQTKFQLYQDSACKSPTVPQVSLSLQLMLAFRPIRRHNPGRRTRT